MAQTLPYCSLIVLLIQNKIKQLFFVISLCFGQNTCCKNAANFKNPLHDFNLLWTFDFCRLFLPSFLCLQKYVLILGYSKRHHWSITG